MRTFVAHETNQTRGGQRRCIVPLYVKGRCSRSAAATLPSTSSTGAHFGYFTVDTAALAASRMVRAVGRLIALFFFALRPTRPGRPFAVNEQRMRSDRVRDLSLTSSAPFSFVVAVRIAAPGAGVPCSRGESGAGPNPEPTEKRP